MFKHNLFIIFRNIKRNKSTFLINLIGLSTGLACVLLIYLWVNDELNFDRFHANNDHLYQIIQKLGNGETQEPTPGPLAETLVAEIPETELAVPIFNVSFLGTPSLSYGDINTKANFVFAGKDIFKMFSFDLLEGDAHQVLAEKNSIVLSNELAEKLFNTTQNIVGQTLELKHQFFPGIFQVTGIFKDVPANSSLQFDFLVPFSRVNDVIPSNAKWTNNNPSTYVLINPNVNIEQYNNKIEHLIERKCGDASRTLFLRPFADKYLYGSYENGKQVGNRIEYVRLFSIIALFILIIACINFMNLSTAKASGRMKEIGMKKTLGADRKSLIAQHLGESMMMAFFSLMLAIMLVQIALPHLNELTGKQISLDLNAGLIVSFLGFTLITGFLSGSYPAIFLTGINPIKTITGKISRSKVESLTRKRLVIFQFVISSILIVTVLVIYKQIEYIQTKKLGYNKDNIIYFDKEGKANENLGTFISELKNIPGVLNASSATFPITDIKSSTEGISWEGKSPEVTSQFYVQSVNYDFIEMHDIKILEGRSFSKDFSTDDSKIIFNETAIKMMDLKDPIGKIVNMWGQDRQIIGVTQDFHYKSFHEKVKPLLFVIAPVERNLRIVVKIKAGTEKETINRIEQIYKMINPGYNLDYNFLDDDFDALYKSETQIGVFSRYFAGMAIIISCLGLFGLAAFTAEKRRKEIGIRKILGSSDSGIIALLTKDFTKIVITSLLISFPISYFISKQWLNGFAYRIELEVWYFLGAGLLTLIIAWITVGTQAIKAALINPVKSLRYE